MAKVGAQRAADLTGKSKSTIQRAMNSGKLSYEMDANKRRIIDVSELERVFGLVPQGGETQAAPSESSVEAELKKAADLIEMERMKMKIKALEDQLETAQDLIEDLKAQRDQWQKQAQQVLITSQYSQQQRRGNSRPSSKNARKKPAPANRKCSNSACSPCRARTRTPKKDRPKKPGQGGNFDFQNLWKKIKGDKAA